MTAIYQPDHLSIKWKTRWEVHVRRWHWGPKGLHDVTTEVLPPIHAPSPRKKTKAFALQIESEEWEQGQAGEWARFSVDVAVVEVRERLIRR